MEIVVEFEKKEEETVIVANMLSAVFFASKINFRENKNVIVNCRYSGKMVFLDLENKSPQIFFKKLYKAIYI